jgi:hypothetical protein
LIRTRLDEQVVARLDAQVLVENACVASSFCGAKKQDETSATQQQSIDRKGQSWNSIMH